MNLTPEQILVALGIVLAVWYLLASIYNRRRGMATYRWLRDGLPVLGDKHEGKWLGSSSSGAHLTVNKANDPFRRVEVIFLLESRELLPLWLFDILRQKRDQVIFKATLRRPRRAELEIAPTGSRRARRLRMRADASWTVREANDFFVASRGRDVVAVMAQVETILAAYGPLLRYLSWSRNKPNLIVVFNLLALLRSGDTAASFLNTLREAFADEQEREHL